MNAVDTNVFIYRLDRSEPAKRAKARDLLRRLRAGPTPTFLLWQVAGELLRHLRYWQDQGLIGRAGVLGYFAAVRRFFPLALPNPGVFDKALDLSGRHSLSHWDSMIVGACLEAGIDTLFTEDMGAPTTLGGVRLINPFI